MAPKMGNCAFKSVQVRLEKDSLVEGAAQREVMFLIVIIRFTVGEMEGSERLLLKAFHLLQSSHLPRTSVQGAVETAIAAGYRHVDTAYSYCNEVGIGKALRSKMQQGIIKRQDMFIVSKVGAAPQCNRKWGHM